MYPNLFFFFLPIRSFVRPCILRTSVVLLKGLTAIAALKKKRKKFSSSKNICPVTESISTSNAADLLNDKVLYICT